MLAHVLAQVNASLSLHERIDIPYLPWRATCHRSCHRYCDWGEPTRFSPSWRRPFRAKGQWQVRKPTQVKVGVTSARRPLPAPTRGHRRGLVSRFPSQRAQARP